MPGAGTGRGQGVVDSRHDGSGRWRMLALLFAVRTAMAFQFQVIGALSPLFVAAYGIGFADIGLLIGLYLAPGIVIALPGGALAVRFGDRFVMTAGVALMVVGGALAVTADSYAGQLAARVVAGVGGAIVNVLATKMVTDWFAGREIATAMAIFVNSWPVGIGLALAALPVIAAAGGLGGALTVTALAAALCLVAMITLCRTAPRPAGAGLRAAWPTGGVLAALLSAAAIWALFNTALILVFSFSPALLTERGYPLIAAGGMTSLVLWVVAATLPIGGIVADRTGRRDAVLVAGLATFALGLLAVRAGVPPLAAFCLIGIGAGLPAGPIMSMPAAVLSPRTRAHGMGLFFTVYYVVTLAGPWLAGRIAAFAGSAAATFDVAVVMLGVCVALVLGFRRIAVRLAPA